MEDNSCKNILLGTGAAQTVVKRELVDPHYFTGEHKVARSFNGFQQSFPLAKTSVRVDGAEHNLEVQVADDLCYDALLGRDIPDLWEIGKRLLYDDFIGIVQTRSNKTEPLQELTSKHREPRDQLSDNSDNSKDSEYEDCPFTLDGRTK